MEAINQKTHPNYVMGKLLSDRYHPIVNELARTVGDNVRYIIQHHIGSIDETLLKKINLAIVDALKAEQDEMIYHRMYYE